MKSNNTTLKSVLAVVLSLAVTLSGNGAASAEAEKSQKELQWDKVQQQVLDNLDVRRNHGSNSGEEYAKGHVCYIREDIAKNSQQIQRDKIQDQIRDMLNVRNIRTQKVYQLTKVNCQTEQVRKQKIQKSEIELQREKVQRQVLDMLNVRS